jgi:DHA2 family lincomycin resistance protein-like MFS transporter
MSSMLIIPIYWQSGKLIAAAMVGILLLPAGIINGMSQRFPVNYTIDLGQSSLFKCSNWICFNIIAAIILLKLIVPLLFCLF